MALIKDKEKQWSKADRQTKLPCLYSNCLRDLDCMCTESRDRNDLRLGRLHNF